MKLDNRPPRHEAALTPVLLQELQHLQGELGSTIEKHESGTRSRKRNGGDVPERTQATKPAEPIAKS